MLQKQPPAAKIAPFCSPLRVGSPAMHAAPKSLQDVHFLTVPHCLCKPQRLWPPPDQACCTLRHILPGLASSLAITHLAAWRD